MYYTCCQSNPRHINSHTFFVAERFNLGSSLSQCVNLFVYKKYVILLPIWIGSLNYQFQSMQDTCFFTTSPIPYTLGYPTCLYSFQQLPPHQESLRETNHCSFCQTRVRLQCFLLCDNFFWRMRILTINSKDSLTCYHFMLPWYKNVFTIALFQKNRFIYHHFSPVYFCSISGHIILWDLRFLSFQWENWYTTLL